MKPRRLIQQLHYHRLRDFTKALEILGLQSMLGKFSKVWGHIMRLFFLRKDPHL